MTQSGGPAGDPPVGVAELLRRWHAGDGAAMEELLARVTPWLNRHVHRNIGQPLKGKLETDDVVQDAVANFLRDAPKFVVEGENQLCALIRQIADNVIRGHHRYFQRKRRQLARERPLSGLTSALLDVGTPSQVAVKDEREARVRLALEMLEPIEQRIVCMRVYDSCSFRAIGEAIGLGEEATRQRFRRALPRLQSKVRCLEDNDVWGFVSGGSSGDSKPEPSGPRPDQEN